MSYLTPEILDRFPQLYKITPQIFFETCKEVLDIEVDYNKSWQDQGIIDALDIIQVIIKLEHKLKISINDDVGVQMIQITNKPPDFKIVNRINNLDKLIP